MIRVGICTKRCRCHHSCRKSRFFGLGTQTCGKLFSSVSLRRSRASLRSHGLCAQLRARQGLLGLWDRDIGAPCSKNAGCWILAATQCEPYGQESNRGQLAGPAHYGYGTGKTLSMSPGNSARAHRTSPDMCQDQSDCAVNFVLSNPRALRIGAD
jgi:hypothetical protein